ncbi:MAG: two component, sigma54 specific, transcriptional regulator, fis family [uncultured bacterium]|nr:MAG: two component, sigma54 specific, transcriptional regulator, fis family [uncultured bacterium]
MLLSIAVKIFILIKLIIKRSTALKSSLSLYFLMGILISSAIQEFDFIIGLINDIFFDSFEHQLFMFSRRMAWASMALQYQFLALFLESIVTKKFTVKLRHKIFFAISALLSLFFIGISIIDIGCIRTTDKYLIEIIIQKVTGFYTYFPLIITSLTLAIWQIKKSNLPRLLQKQLRLLLTVVIIPLWIFDLVQITPFIFSLNLSWLNTGYAAASTSTILLTTAILYCSKKIIGLRFLNWSPHVQSPIDIDFMENFKIILERFSRVTSIEELTHITQGFFKEAFRIPYNRVHLHIRSTQHHRLPQEEDGSTVALVEAFMSTHAKTMCEYLKKNTILIYDELAFTDFYESTAESSQALHFLDGIQADIFLPVYEKDTMIAYIVVDRFARFDSFYTSTEYDEMLIFVRYLSNIINLMQNKNLDMLIRQEKELQEELYAKHQEISQYKESIRSFLRNQRHKDIGIIFYKNRRFSFGNQAAKELIGINPNLQEGHATAKALKHLAQQVLAYKAAQTVHTKDSDGNKLILSGMPSLEHHNVIISVYYPEVTDVIKKQIDMLRDPSEWDYLLYLETTKPGKLINHLIPGSGETLLNFKIELLKTALSKKATLLNIAERDVRPMVELLHHVSLRETLHVIELTEPVKNFEIAIKLFGINALFNNSKAQSAPLLEALDAIGTIFIKNIDLLDLETQEYLAEFIRYGFFRVFKSEHKISSNVRIICSSNKDLGALVRENKFSQSLFNELKHTTLEMPSLLTLPEDELAILAEGFSEQAIVNQTYKNLLSLSEKDKFRLAHHRPASLEELKLKVQQILIQKSKKSDIYDETQFDPAYEVSDPELVQAARLGKKALKDQKTMSLLWNKFKNQNKIASFLGVNRSSVNRRCKQYHLEE